MSALPSDGLPNIASATNLPAVQSAAKLQHGASVASSAAAPSPQPQSQHSQRPPVHLPPLVPLQKLRASMSEYASSRSESVVGGGFGMGNSMAQERATAMMAQSQSVAAAAMEKMQKWVPRLKNSETKGETLRQRIEEQRVEIAALKAQLASQRETLKMHVESQMRIEWAQHVDRLLTAGSVLSRASQASSRSTRKPPIQPQTNDATPEQQAAFALRTAQVMQLCEQIYNYNPVRHDLKKGKGRKPSKQGLATAATKYAEHGGDGVESIQRPEEVGEELFDVVLQLRQQRLRAQHELQQREPRLDLYTKRSQGISQLVRITTYSVAAAKQSAEDAQRNQPLWPSDTLNASMASVAEKKR